jgi:hypothetical protein
MGTSVPLVECRLAIRVVPGSLEALIEAVNARIAKVVVQQ